MSKIQSHENCTHESSKAARAKCRRSRAKFADVFADALNEHAAGTATVPTASPVFEPVRVTADTWRDFKETPVRIATQIDDETDSEIATGVYLTGWGKQWINYTNDEGKTKRASITCVRVTTLGEA